MKPSEIFGIIVRTVGLLACLSAASLFFMALYVGEEAFITGAAMLPIGIWMLRGAPALIDFAYPEELRYPKDSQGLVDWMTSDRNP